MAKFYGPRVKLNPSWLIFLLLPEACPKRVLMLLSCLQAFQSHPMPPYRTQPQRGSSYPIVNSYFRDPCPGFDRFRVFPNFCSEN